MSREGDDGLSKSPEASLDNDDNKVGQTIDLRSIPVVRCGPILFGFSDGGGSGCFLGAMNEKKGLDSRLQNQNGVTVRAVSECRQAVAKHFPQSVQVQLLT